MPLRRLLRIDWDVVAGIIAALVAMLLSFMGLVSETVGIGIILLLCALLLIRDLRGEAREHRMFDKLDIIKRNVSSLTTAGQADIHLIGAKRMRQEFADFATTVYGEVRWFNACCRMFRRQEVFDATLRPFIDNPHVTTVQLLCRPDERRYWLTELLPKLRRCDHAGKVRAPLWGAIHTNVSFILGDIDGDGRDEALMSITEEPFSAVNQGPAVPRFLVRVFSQCDLIAPLEDMARHATSDFLSEEAADEMGRASVAAADTEPPAPADPPAA
ncbi:MAG: hypothetical protein ACKOZU_06530 [Planctomycetaceae bacterium]